MILLESGTYSTITLTLSEKSNGATSSYVLQFIHTQSQRVITATASDISLWTSRYNRFILDLGVLQEGYYDYSAWEVGFPGTILETGKALVQITNNGLGTTYSTTYTTTKNIIVYNG